MSRHHLLLSLLLLAIALVVVVGTLWWWPATSPMAPPPTTKPSPPPTETHSSKKSPNKKERFFGMLYPHIERSNNKVLAQRQQLLQWQDEGKVNPPQIADLCRRYRLRCANKTEDIILLLAVIDIVPPALALAQAANESAWGTSRFARQYHNFFGLWCFKPGCGVVPARRAAGKSHEVQRFDSAAESVDAYILTLNRGDAYRPLRELRQRARRQQQPFFGAALAVGLQRYSARGMAYVQEIQAMIRHNDLQRYDRRYWAQAVPPP